MIKTDFKKFSISFFIIIILTLIIPSEINDNTLLSTFGFPFPYLDIPSTLTQGKTLLSSININLFSLTLDIAVIYCLLSIFSNNKSTTKS